MMTTHNSSRRVLVLLAFSLLATSLAACQRTASVRPSPSFTMSHESALVLDEVPAPRIKPCDNARVAWRWQLAARIEANHRLRVSRSNVRDEGLKASAIAK
ncbi:conserved exported protein of unknown function [Bradyrhizobium sp. ORS 285]|nr:conserved exported hypothetical protein [Bradyrhizobium sp. ORS 285]SMX56390.1 conserved exported protein of unknown function [Bradyrhizobium sp. ORS 285]